MSILVSCYMKTSQQWPPTKIPLINIAPFLDSQSSADDRASVVTQVKEACITYGFFQLVGHGIPLEMQRGVLKLAKTFFDLPQEKKNAAHMSRAMGLSNRGYEAIGGQQLQADALPDIKEVCF
jgi:isopenicillin N synthase-like dioxygenase